MQQNMDQFIKASQVKQKIKPTLELDAYLNFYQMLAKTQDQTSFGCFAKTDQYPQVQKGYQKAFKKLSQKERINFYFQIIKALEKPFQLSQPSLTPPQHLHIIHTIFNVQYAVQYNPYQFCFKLSKQNNQHQQIYLNQYFYRESKNKQKNQIILVGLKGNQIRIQIQGQSRQFIRQVVMYCKKKQLIDLLPKNSITEKLLYNYSFQKPPQEILNQIQNQTQHFQSQKLNPVIYTGMFPQYSFDTIVSNLDSLQRNIIKKGQIGKLLVLDMNRNSQEVGQILINPFYLNNLSSLVQTLSIKQYLPSQNTLLLYIKLKNNKDYVFLRHVFSKGEIKLVCDRSVDHISYPPFGSLSRGYLKRIIIIKGSLVSIEQELIGLNEQQQDKCLWEYKKVQKIDSNNYPKILNKDWQPNKQDNMQQSQSELSQLSIVQSNLRVYFQKKQTSKSIATLQQNKSFYHPIIQQNTPKIYLTANHPLTYQKHQNKKVFKIYPKDWIIDDKGGLVYTNQTVINRQKKVISYIIGKIGNNLFSGKGIMDISLPVDIFSDKSNLQMFARGLSLAPKYLQSNLPIYQQFVQFFKFSLSFSILYISMEKPFNPLLGQTFQCFIQGNPVYCEQISHHPPNSAFYMIGKGYKVWGNLQSEMEIGMNSGKGKNKGLVKMQKDNCVYQSQQVSGQMTGLTIGTRKLNFVDKCCYFCIQKQLFLCVNFSQSFFSTNKSDCVQGQIFKCTVAFMKSLKKKIRQPDQDQILQRGPKISGRWTQQLFADNKSIFKLRQVYASELIPYEYALPSNSNLRKDIQLRTKEDFVNSQIQKQILEQEQRKDRKLRQKFKFKK